MCDIKRINDITKELMNLKASDYTQLIIAAESDEMRKIYVTMYNHFLQKRQIEVIKENAF